MEGKVDDRGPDAAVAALAALQHGVVAKRQLHERGLRDGQIEHRVRCGRLHRIHRGVYAVGHPALAAREGRWLAAVLACGPGAVLSHRSAAALWGLCAAPTGPVEVTIAATHGRRGPAGVRVHRSHTLAADVRAVHHGVPVSTVARTLLDLAATRPFRAVARAVDEAEALRLFDLEAAEALLERHRGQPGTRALARAIAGWGAPAPTRSELERAFVALCREHGLTRPAINARVLDFEVDFLWPDRRLVVETDGFEHHGTRAAFERDRARDRRLQEEGYRVVRFTHRQVTGDAPGVAASLRRLLG